MSENSPGGEEFYDPLVKVRSEHPLIKAASKLPVVGTAIEEATSATQMPQRYSANSREEAQLKAEAYAEMLKGQGFNAVPKVSKSEGRKMF